VEQERLARFSTRIEGGGGRARREPDARPVLIERWRGIGERVAVHGLERSNAFEQEIDTRTPHLTLMTLLDPSPQRARVAIGIPEPLELGVELAQLLFVATRD